MLNKKSKLTIIIVAIVSIIAIVLFTLIVGSKTYEVKFYSDNNTIIKVDNVKRNGVAIPPNAPQITYGKIFQGWDKDFSSVNKNLDIFPICKDISNEENVFAISSVYCKTDDIVTVPLRLCGKVNLCAFDITVNYTPESLELVSVTDEDGAIVVNSETPGTIKINFISSNNTVGDVDICNFNFSPKKKGAQESIEVMVNNVWWK